MLYIFSGLPGVGKTTLAKQLAAETRSVYLRIDTIEQGLRDFCNFDVEGEGYQLAYRVAAENLELGASVVADSVNPIQLTRREWENVAACEGVKFINIEIICTDLGEHKRRVQCRNSGIQNIKMPNWDAIVSRDYHAWDRERIQIDTAGNTTKDAYSELRASLLTHSKINADPSE